MPVPPPATAPPYRLGRLTEPQVLFPLLTLLLLGVLWIATASLVRQEHANARAAAAASTRELAETYEAQVVRALREIDRTLKLVAYADQASGPAATLSALAERGLLLPPFLFTVSITDADGAILASTRAGPHPIIADRDYFDAVRRHDGLTIGAPARTAADDEWTLTFSRPLVDAAGDFVGAATIAVPASYFVSSYEAGKLGQHGFVGLLGSDGIFRVSRSGDTVAAGWTASYRELVPTASDIDQMPVTLRVNAWDGVERYTATRELYEFPVAIVVGLSAAEQLRPAIAHGRTYLLRSAAASVLLIALMALLGRLSWQLQQSRLREAQEQFEHAKRIEYMAQHDSLTDLPNRSFFSHMLNRLLALARRYQRPLAVLFLDLDRFKLVNDTLGHDAGDALLKEVARRLNTAVRESDIVARLGGDEFMVLLPEPCDEASLTVVAQRILAAVGKPYDLLGHAFRVTVSIGISRYPEDAEDEESLINHADVAMYGAKEQGRNTFQLYDPGVSQPSLERLTLESALRQALERHEFSLHYQEQRDLNSGEVTGLEALLRWQHPQLGLVLPKRFLPLAEESGLILPIGHWAIETACRHGVAMQARYGRPLTMCVNLSARQFADPHLTHELKRILDASGLAPQHLELAVAESVLLANVEQAMTVLGQIRALGVRVAIDNFGASYSSLSTLNRFRFDTVNIDGSVVRNYEHSPEDRKLTEATIAMGRNLAFTVVAEGVETEAQATFLRERACDKAQGFYFSPPAAPPPGAAGSPAD
jgi:diguanylate cyclase (GGDEF)-like protein